MPRLILLCFFLIHFLIVNGQQDPLLTGEGIRSFWYNPATTATFNAYSVNSSGRMDVVDGYANPTVFQLNAAYKYRIATPAEKMGKSLGFGLNYYNDRIAFQRFNSLLFHTNFQLKLGKTYLSTGIAFGLQTLNFKGDWIPPSGVPDPVIEGLSKSETQFDLGVGLNWYGDRFCIGVASKHINEAYFEDKAFQMARHYYINGMYRLPITKSFELKAIGTLRTDVSVVSYQSLLFAVLPKNDISIGIGYRNSSSFLAAFSFRFSKFYVGYFIDYHRSNWAGHSFSHEFRIAFELFDYYLNPNRFGLGTNSN